MKTCSVCAVEKEDTSFETSRLPDGRLITRSKCRQCKNRHDSDTKRGRTKALQPRKVLAIGDIHFPFHSQECLDWIYERASRTEAITDVVQMGDLNDMFSTSRFPRSYSVITPEEELERAREESVKFWVSVQQAVPKANYFQLTGNHDERPMKRVLEKAPELEPFVGKGMLDLMTFDGVKTIHNANEDLDIEGVIYQHGWTSQGKHAARNRRSTVVGHLHKAGVTYFADADGVYFELNVGCCIHLDAAVFDYRISKFRDRVTLGFGLIDSDGPRFVGFPKS